MGAEIMRDIEHQIQSAAVKEIEFIFQTRFKDYLLMLKNSKGEVVPSSPLFAVPNGGKRHVATAVKLKREGAKSGVADLILPIANKYYSQLWIEVKQPKKKQSHNQIQWESLCNQIGIKYEVCYSTQEIIDTVIFYMEGI
jgi:hypothetical protein